MNVPGFVAHVPEFEFPLESVYLNMKRYTSFPVHLFWNVNVPSRVGTVNVGTISIGPVTVVPDVHAIGLWLIAHP
jgi:hypothetical protein